MADLTTEFLGYKLKNPIGVSSCSFGGTEHDAKLVLDQGIGWLTGKTIHKINGPHHWPRPFFYSLKKFGPEMKDVWVCSQMFSEIPYDQWMSVEGPKIVKACHDANVMFIGSVAAAGEEPEDWEPIMRDMESIGVDAIEPMMVSNHLDECLEQYGDQITFMGGIDNQMIDRAETTEEEIRAEVRRAIDAYAKKGRYIPYYIPTMEQKWFIYMDEVNKYGRTVNPSEK